MRVSLVKNRWNACLYANNVTNKHAALTINNTVFGWQGPTSTQVTTNLPRTIGLEHETKF